MSVVVDTPTRRLRNVLWIGGSVCAGKSSSAVALADRYWLRRYHFDRQEPWHIYRSVPERQPGLIGFMAMTTDQRWVLRSPEAMAGHTLACWGDERFSMVVDDLLGMGEGARIVAEGAGLVPERVAPLLATPTTAAGPMGVRFEPATPAALDVLLAMVRELYRADHIPLDERTSRAALGELMVDPRAGRVWLMVADTTPVGYLVVTFGSSLEYGGRAAFIDELWVHERFRRQGLGTRALHVAEAACREQGIRALHLEVERSNTIAQQVYRRAGFVDHDRYLLTKRLDAS